MIETARTYCHSCQLFPYYFFGKPLTAISQFHEYFGFFYFTKSVIFASITIKKLAYFAAPKEHRYSPLKLFTVLFYENPTNQSIYLMKTIFHLNKKFHMRRNNLNISLLAIFFLKENCDSPCLLDDNILIKKNFT